MLNVEENELLCRIGPGTPMGNLIRQYWIPALLPSELPTPDCPPMRLRMLGENLIAFRTTSGDVGIIQNACRLVRLLFEPTRRKRRRRPFPRFVIS